MGNRVNRASGALLAVVAWTLSTSGRSGAQITASGLALLAPSEAEISQTARLNSTDPPIAFGRVQPVGERFTRARKPVPDTTIGDFVSIQVKPRRSISKDALVSYIQRDCYSVDKRFRISALIECTSSSDVALGELGHNEGASAIPKSGIFTNDKVLGDDSWTIGGDETGSYLSLRCGRMVVELSGHITSEARRNQVSTPIAPTVLDALACRILFAASQAPDITGVTSKSWQVAINGTMAQGITATEVAGHVIVSPVELCKAAAVPAAWIADKSAVEITRSTTVTVLPGWSTARPLTGSETKLGLPPFVFGGRCLMDLDDLLNVLGGSRSTDGGTIMLRL